MVLFLNFLFHFIKSRVETRVLCCQTGLAQKVQLQIQDAVGEPLSRRLEGSKAVVVPLQKLRWRQRREPQTRSELTAVALSFTWRHFFTSQKYTNSFISLQALLFLTQSELSLHFAPDVVVCWM